MLTRERDTGSAGVSAKPLFNWKRFAEATQRLAALGTAQNGKEIVSKAGYSTFSEYRRDLKAFSDLVEEMASELAEAKLASAGSLTAGATVIHAASAKIDGGSAGSTTNEPRVLEVPPAEKAREICREYLKNDPDLAQRRGELAEMVLKKMRVEGYGFYKSGSAEKVVGEIIKLSKD
jgi:hypothetical protein